MPTDPITPAQSPSMLKDEAVIDYDRTSTDYEASLVTKLRGHGAGSFLENWVPDTDPVLGILNMIEAAWTAGRNRLVLSVARSTLDDAALERLGQLAEGLAAIRIDPQDRGYLISAECVAEQRSKRRKAAAPGRRAAPRESAGVARQAVGAPTVQVPLLPSLVQALEAETADFTHEGSLGEGSGTTRVDTAGEGGTLSLWVSAPEGVIRAARHAAVSPPVRRRLLELMCRAIEFRTVQDAADHAATYVIHRLRSRAADRPVTGVLLAANAGTEVLDALRLVRKACGACRDRLGQTDTANFFELRSSETWRSLSPESRLQRVRAATAEFCRARGLAPESMTLLRLDKDLLGDEVRVFINTEAQVSAAEKPALLRQVERFLKTQVESKLHIYLEPVKDKNIIRRL